MTKTSSNKWVALTDLAKGCSSSQIEQLIRDERLGLRGEYCVDFTDPARLGRRDPEEIPRDFILNARIDAEKGTLKADPDYCARDGELNYSMYSFVEFALDDWRELLAPKRGRPFVHDWEAIKKIVADTGRNWKGSQNALVREVLRTYRASTGTAPDPSTVKKNLKLELQAALAKSGA